MSLPDFLQNNLEFVINELTARATQQLMSNGHVDDRLLDILDGLESFLPKPVAVEPEPVVETPQAIEAFTADVPHEQFTHPDDVVEAEEIK